jgi:hypothetical protein
MYQPLDAEALSYASVYNIVPWTKQGTAFLVGGSFTTISGQPSLQLLASSNTTQGYFNGQMLARASGVKADASPSGLTAGALINFSPTSPSEDTGQIIWNGMVIIDPALKQPLPLLDPVTGDPFVYPGTIQVASQMQGWVIRQQYLYCSGTPATDAILVDTAVTTTTAVRTLQSQTMNSSNALETIFAY